MMPNAQMNSFKITALDTMLCYNLSENAAETVAFVIIVLFNGSILNCSVSRYQIKVELSASEVLRNCVNG